MPLSKGKSNKSFVHNIKAELHAGKPRDQALAIAYSVKRRSHKANGGLVEMRHLESTPKDMSIYKETAMNERKGNFADGGDIMNEKLNPSHEDMKAKRRSRLLEHLFGFGGESDPNDEDPAMEQMESANEDKDLFLSDEGDSEMDGLADGGEVMTPEMKRKTRLKGILSEIQVKRAK